MKLHQYAIYQIRGGAEHRKLRFCSYQYMKEQQMDIRVENYEQVYISSALPEDSAEKIWQRFLKQPPKNFKGFHSLSVSDVIAYNKEGVTACYYVDKERIVPVPGFIKLNSSAALISMETDDFHVEGKKGNWVAADEVIVDGRQFFLMENDVYKQNVGFLVVSDTGDIVAEDVTTFSATETIEAMRRYLLPAVAVIEPVQNQPPEKLTYQKYYENGEYLRSAESGTEQNYNMIDGNVNNKPRERSKQRASVLAKLHQKQSEIAKRSGKAVPQMSMEEGNERNRK